MPHFQTFFGKTYMFTKDCIDKDHGSVMQNLISTPDYCVTNPCWDRSKFPFCLCTGDNDEIPINGTNYSTGCSKPEEKFSGPYVEGETETYNQSFKDPLIGMVRLVVLISTENYPDVMCKFFHFVSVQQKSFACAPTPLARVLLPHDRVF